MLKKYLPWVIFVSTITIFIGINTYYQQVYMLPTQNNTLFTSNDRLKTLFKNQKKDKHTVVYFWQKYCPCDGMVLPHFKEVIQEYKTLGVQFMIANLSPSPDPQSMIKFPQLPKEQLHIVKTAVKHTPSVGVWNQDGKLVYFGPHNIGFVCNAKSSFLIKVLDGLLSKRPYAAQNAVGDGCFCATKGFAPIES